MFLIQLLATALTAHTDTLAKIAFAPLLFAAIPSVAQAIQGIFQGDKADRIANAAKRPKKTVNQNYKDNVALAAFKAANSKLPGANILETKLSSGVQGGVNNLVNTQRDPSSIAAGVAALDNNYNKSLEDLTVKGAQYKDQQDRLLLGQRAILGQQEDQAWDWNQKQPYLASMAAASALRNASGRNIHGGIQGLSTIGVLAATGGAGGSPGGIGGSYPINAPGSALKTAGTLAGGAQGMGGNGGYAGLPGMQQKILQWRQLNSDYTTPDADIMGQLIQ